MVSPFTEANVSKALLWKMPLERLSGFGLLESLESSSSGFGVGGDTIVHEVTDGDCVVEPEGCAGEVEELGASSRSASRKTTGVEGGAEDEAGNWGFHCPGLVSVHFRAEPELVGCSFVSCGATEGRAVKHSEQRVLETPLRQCLLQKCFEQISQVIVAKV